MTTPREVNRELAKLGTDHRLYRNQLGGCYYYFSGDLRCEIPSIYMYSLKDTSTEWVLDHFRHYWDKRDDR